MGHSTGEASLNQLSGLDPASLLSNYKEHSQASRIQSQGENYTLLTFADLISSR